MLKDISIGQYFPGDSFVHKLDPRTKLFAVILFITAIFFVETYVMYIPMVLFILGVVVIAKIPFTYLLKGLRPLFYVIIVTFIINLLLTPGKEVFRLAFIRVTEEGIHQAVFMGIRLILLVLGTSLLTLTTSPTSLTDGLERLLKPLSKIGFPAHEFAMMISIAMRFIPTLFEETDKIMKAQMARGADFESGNIINRAKNLVPLLVPLFINSWRRAGELATAMEARCYRGGDQRTKLNELKLLPADWGTMAFLVLFFGLIIVAKNFIS